MWDSWIFTLSFISETSGSLIISCRLRTTAPSSIMDSLLKWPPPRAAVNHQPILRRVNLGGRELLLVALELRLAQFQGPLLRFDVGRELGQFAFALQLDAVQILLGLLQRRLQGALLLRVVERLHHPQRLLRLAPASTGSAKPSAGPCRGWPWFRSPSCRASRSTAAAPRRSGASPARW